VSHKKEQQGVGRDVQVEISKTMQQKSQTRSQSGEMKNGNKRTIREAQTLPALYQQNSQEPGAAGASENARFGQRFQVVVVRMIHNLAIVVGLIFGKTVCRVPRPVPVQG